MFAVERIKIIKKMLIKDGKVSVNELSKMLDVSEVTIRRDLEKLESENFLIRTHGGAVLKKDQLDDNLTMPSSYASNSKRDYHKEIAEIAIHTIQDNDIIMLTNGPINYKIASLLNNKKNITILTNDLNIALEASKNADNKVVILGGDVSPNDSASYGALTALNIQKFFVKKIFIEVDAINEDLNIFVSSMEKADLIHNILPNSKERILLCRGDNFNKMAFYSVSDITIADKLITNSNISEDVKRLIFNKNIPLYTSINAVEEKL